MTYQETTEYLFNSAPLFQNIGGAAYKEGLENTRLLDEHFHHPHHRFRTIHVAGTNGKGSCSHTLAAVLQSAGYKVGLYTSPHLVDFRERIRVNGKMIPEQRVIDFVEQERAFFEPLHPSFFELATALAFAWFAECEVDVAVIEVGLGGRLDCTNIITPDLCVITNISFDHVQFLGHTLGAIAGEKAGIIKHGVPVVIGETTKETRPVFLHKAQEMNAPIYFAEEENEVVSSSSVSSGLCLKHTDCPDHHTPPGASNRFGRLYHTRSYGELYGELGGLCQQKNTATLLTSLRILRSAGYRISDENIRDGFARVCESTGLIGRWQIINQKPLTICDTGHNMGGISYIVQQLAQLPGKQLRMVWGMVSDKDISGVLGILPRDAVYYFTRASVRRALPETDMQRQAEQAGLTGTAYPTVKAAFRQACADADAEDVIFVGGSSFVVADLLSPSI